jgi:putative transposase
MLLLHDRRRILHFNVSRHSISAGVIQQLREAFLFDPVLDYLIFDRGSSISAETIEAVKRFGIQPKRTSFRSLWQNGVAQRWAGNCRRDLLDYVIVLNKRHLKCLMNEYVLYFHDDRAHLGLDKQTSVGRVAAKGTNVGSEVASIPRLGGLHHRYETGSVSYLSSLFTKSKK